MAGSKRLRLYRRGYDASSFIIHVYSRENACWQGEIEHVQSGNVIRFRSCLELITLMDEMLKMLNFPQATFQTRQWEESEMYFRDVALQ